MGYPRQLPLEKNNYPISTVPAFTSYQSKGGNPVTSSVLTLSPNTTVIDVMAIGTATGAGGVIGKWGTASVTSSNFDIQVNAGQNRTFAVPQSVFGAPLASVAGANAANGLYNSISFLSVGVSSVYTAEY